MSTNTNSATLEDRLALGAADNEQVVGNHDLQLGAENQEGIALAKRLPQIVGKFKQRLNLLARGGDGCEKSELIVHRRVGAGLFESGGGFISA
jgi:hypothetical protein